jgi:hypothetical protein
MARAGPTGVVVGSSGAGVSGSSLTVGRMLPPWRNACEETSCRPAGSVVATVTRKVMVTLAPGARLGRWTDG